MGIGDRCEAPLYLCGDSSHRGYFMEKVCFKGILLLDGTFNLIGEVLVEFYIETTRAVLAPFDCFKHTTGDSSVEKYFFIICGDSSHIGMMSLTIVASRCYCDLTMADLSVPTSHDQE